MSAEFHELAAAYVLDALDDAERARFEAQLAGDAELQAIVQSLRPVADYLAEQAARPVPAPLRAAVVDAIAATPQVPVVVDLNDRRAPRRARWLAAAAAIVAVIGGVLVTNAVISNDSDPATIADADDAVRTRLDGAVDADATATAGSVEVVYSPAGRDAAVIGSGVAELDDGLVYELWAVAEGEVIRAGEFEPSEGGDIVGRVDDSRFDLADVTTWVITVEPDGGVDVATGDAVFVGDVAT